MKYVESTHKRTLAERYSEEPLQLFLLVFFIGGFRVDRDANVLRRPVEPAA